MIDPFKGSCFAHEHLPTPPHLRRRKVIMQILFELKKGSKESITEIITRLNLPITTDEVTLALGVKICTQKEYEEAKGKEWDFQE